MSNLLSANIPDDELQLIARSRPFESGSSQAHELRTAPLFTREVFEVAPHIFPYRGLLGTVLQQYRAGLATVPKDPRLYVNTQTPFSAVVCGVQGSGKSHSVSCLLEDSLIHDTQIGGQPEPLAAVVFHFDEEHGGRPCEAAYLSSPSPSSKSEAAVKDVTILVSPGNLKKMTHVYNSLPNVRVRPLYLHESHLNASRMLSMMACDDIETLPLYMFVALSIMRDIGSDDFSYAEFKRKLREPEFNPAQRAGIEIRTSLLDSFIDEYSDDITNFFGKGKLVIVDLSDPFLDGGRAALLFDLILGLFVEWETNAGKIVVLDEAHKYLTKSDSARLTKSVSSLIRQQRHLGMRVIVSTQEPTVIPSSILDLTSFIICHKFSSPTWCSHLSSHVSIKSSDGTQQWFEQVMQLRTGQALLFSSGALGVAETDNPTEESLLPLGVGHLLIHTRPRITLDGGSSIMAGHQFVTQRDSASRPMIERVNDQPVRVVTPPALPALPTLPVPAAPLVLTKPERTTPSFQATTKQPNLHVQDVQRPAPTMSPSGLKSTSSKITPTLSSFMTTSSTVTPISSTFMPTSSTTVTRTSGPVGFNAYLAGLVKILEEQRQAHSPATCFQVSKIFDLVTKKHPNFCKAFGLGGWKRFYAAAQEAGAIRVAELPGLHGKWMYLPSSTLLIPAP